MQALLEQAVTAQDRRASADALAQIHQITYEAAVRLPVVHSRPLTAARTYVQGWVPGPTLVTPFEDIRLEGKD